MSKIDTSAPIIPMDEVKKQADALGCYMQLFVAYNPETEMIMIASNAPDADNHVETALLLALAGAEISDKLKEKVSELDAAPVTEGDDVKPVIN